MKFYVMESVQDSKKICMVLSDFDVDKGMVKWVTLLGRVFKIRDFLCMNLSDFVVVDR